MVKLISPQFVKPYVKGNKSDSRDAEAIREAVSRPHMRFVPLKTVESQDIQAIHHLRSRLMKERTALVNQIRGLLAERGIVIAQGITQLRKQLPMIVEDEANELTPMSREVMRELYVELVALDERVTRADALVQRVFTQSTACQKLAQVEGIGPVVATALVAAVDNAKEFANGRHLPAIAHTVGKIYTQQIERKHLTLRTRIKRLARKTSCFSKSVFMHDTVNGLFVNRYEFGIPV